MTDRVLIATFLDNHAVYEAATALRRLKESGQLQFRIKALIAGLNTDFIDADTSTLRPGLTAIVLEAAEASAVPLDCAVRAAGGQVYGPQAHEADVHAPGSAALAPSSAAFGFSGLI